MTKAGEIELILEKFNYRTIIIHSTVRKDTYHTLEMTITAF